TRSRCSAGSCRITESHCRKGPSYTIRNTTTSFCRLSLTYALRQLHRCSTRNSRPLSSVWRWSGTAA
ncbi:unnamed protein product, partial [Amoebophrya sp. A120]